MVGWVSREAIKHVRRECNGDDFWGTGKWRTQMKENIHVGRKKERLYCTQVEVSEGHSERRK